MSIPTKSEGSLLVHTYNSTSEAMSELSNIHHVCISVVNIEQSVAWYTSSFSCEIVYQDKREAILQFANIRLVLSLPSIQQRHLAFVREDAATLGELFEQTDGTLSTTISDPSGNLVELVATSSSEK